MDPSAHSKPAALYPTSRHPVQTGKTLTTQSESPKLQTHPSFHPQNKTKQTKQKQTNKQTKTKQNPKQNKKPADFDNQSEKHYEKLLRIPYPA